MTKKKLKRPSELQQLHDWLNGVGGAITLGESVLKDVDVSKSGSKITITLKKPDADNAVEAPEGA